MKRLVKALQFLSVAGDDFWVFDPIWVGCQGMPVLSPDSCRFAGRLVPGQGARSARRSCGGADAEGALEAVQPGPA